MNVIDIAGKALGSAATIAFSALLLLLIWRYFREALGFEEPASPMAADENVPAARVALTVLLAFVLSRLLIMLSGYIYAKLTGGLYWHLVDYPSTWIRWDAHHYIKIAEQWYINEGDDQYKIVFFPLYSLVARGLSGATGLSARAACLIVSNACLAGAGWAMHALVHRDHGASAANRAVWLMMFSPLSLFFSTAYTESMFLLLSILAALMARKKRYVLAVTFGALCAATRMLGLATAPVIFFSMLRDAWATYSASRDGARRRDGAFIARAALCVARVLPVALGFAAYLLLNYVITGDAWTFLVHQEEHWGQTFGSLYNTVAYTFQHALTYRSFDYRVFLWIPQLAAIFAALAILWASWRKQQPGDAAFSVLYYYGSIAPTWLLSGMRYLNAMYPLYAALALITSRRWVFALVMAIFVSLCAYTSAIYCVVGLIL